MRFVALALIVGALVPAAAPAEPLAPVEAVRACPGHGPGFYAIPGSDTCIRLGGRVTSEFTAASRRAPGAAAGFGSTGQLSLDTRTDTAYGPLRTFVRMRVRAGATGPGR